VCMHVCFFPDPLQSLSELQSSMGQSASQAADRLARLEADCADAKAQLGAVEAEAGRLRGDLVASKEEGVQLTKRCESLQQELDSER
jgi:hypothetical protein